jgi:hypothetical protein
MGKQSNNGFEIPARFKRVVILHVIKNFLRQENFKVPLLLGIHGPSGEGKTFQCEQVLQEINAKLFLISGGQLESDKAGQPAELIRTTYLDAGQSIEKNEAKIAVVMINDIDTGLGNWGEMVQYTINRQTVFGELMHLVDYPNFVEGRAARRVPIIITGNDFTRLYEPLVRAGRMTAFEWAPTTAEKVPIVSCIFPEINLVQCKALIKELEAVAEKVLPGCTLPVAVYAHLRGILSDEYIWSEIQKVGLLRTVDLINQGHQPKMDLAVEFEQLVEAGKELIQSGQLISHLRKAK